MTATGPIVAGEPASERLLRQVERECAARGKPVPTCGQVAAVLHALADHTAIVAAFRWRHEEESPWPEATSVGRWFHDTADALDRTEHS